MPRIQFQKIWDDPDGTLQIVILVANDSYMASDDCFVTSDQICQFGKDLQDFPKNLDHEVTLDIGSDDPKWYNHIVLRAFVYDPTGHSAIEVKMDNHSDPPSRASANFYLIGEPASLNRIGEQIFEWAGNMSDPLDIEWKVT